MKSLQHYINAIKTRGATYINKRRGWTTYRKIVVIESDDWGSIRMPDRETYEKSLKFGIRSDKCSFNKYDTLASINDFDALYNVLRRHTDKNGTHPVITANAVMANPDFEKIRESNFSEYNFELYTETLKKYPNRSFEMWQQGMDEKLFFPQLHGREHLNIERWMSALQRGSKEVLFAFQNNYFGISTTISNEANSSFMAALDYDNDIGKEIAMQGIDQSIDLFKDIFGYNSKSFIACNYVWDNNIENVLNKKGIKYLQGSFNQNTPAQGIKRNFIGKQNTSGQIYLTRNVTFEPSSDENKDWVSGALKEIDQSFKLKKPAIFSTHRVAFIGSIFEENRTKNLKMLDELLKQIIKRWPEVEFMHTADLGDIIYNS